MKQDIHPDYQVATVQCSCGNRFETRSTRADLHVEICSNCHPFYTGKQKLVDSGGRVERFQKRYAKQQAVQEKAKGQGSSKASTATASKPGAPEPVPQAPEAPSESPEGSDGSAPADA